jgi:hypothetical protein
LDKFAGAEPKLSKEIIEKFAKYYAKENLPISNDLSLNRSDPLDDSLFTVFGFRPLVSKE